MFPQIATSVLHAGSCVYQLVYVPATKEVTKRYVRLYMVKTPGTASQEMRIITQPQAISDMLRAAQRYNLHECPGYPSCSSPTTTEPDLPALDSTTAQTLQAVLSTPDTSPWSLDMLQYINRKLATVIQQQADVLIRSDIDPETNARHKKFLDAQEALTDIIEARKEDTPEPDPEMSDTSTALPF